MFSLLIANIVYVLIGYVVAVLFPLPWLSSAVLAFWAAFGAKITSFFSGVETEVEDAVHPTTTTTGTSVVAPVSAPVVPPTSESGTTPTV